MQTAHHDVADYRLTSGRRLPRARLAYAVIGEMSPARDNVVLFPTRVAGRIADNLHMIGPGRALDPARFCIIIPALLGNGESSSPSTDRADFSAVSIEDSARLQHHLLAALGISRLHAVVGWSMGGQQAYQWASQFPAQVARLAVICGAAATSPFSQVFLHSLHAALTADAAWADGNYAAPPVTGLRALGRAWAPWAFSEPWYRRGRYREIGFATLDDFMTGFWDSVPLGWDANDVLCQLDTWSRHDIGLAHQGDRARGLAAITAPTLLMPCTTDAYFQAEDNHREAAGIAGARVVPIESDWGHMAGAGMNPADAAAIDAALAELVA